MAWLVQITRQVNEQVAVALEELAYLTDKYVAQVSVVKETAQESLEWSPVDLDFIWNIVL